MDLEAKSCRPSGGGAPRTAAGDLAYVVAALNAKGAGINLQTATRVRARRRDAAQAGVGQKHASVQGKLPMVVHEHA